ncbi:DMT family transporter [Roseomonas sp. BN140053]|uniref:DMT family transporter n=1 Tax=Roseomonas sp. BN140053 TaxID=3391898 RepID=UPI0039EB83D6
MIPSAEAARGRAILCVVGAALFFSLAAAAVKGLGGSLPLAELILFRNLLALPVLLPLALAQGGWSLLRTRDPLGHAQRCFWGLLGTAGPFYGYAHLPLATVTAINFAMPLFLTALSVPLLGERVGPRRAAAVAVGLCGVLLMLRPGMGAGAASPDLVAVGAVVAGAFSWAMAMISIRRMGERGEAGVTIVLWFTLGAAGVSLLLALPVWVWPTPLALGLLAAVGLLSAVGQLLMTAGYRSGETTLLAPFEYSAILWTTLMGTLIWAEVPDGWDAGGVAILVASGLYIWHREVTLGLRR